MQGEGEPAAATPIPPHPPAPAAFLCNACYDPVSRSRSPLSAPQSPDSRSAVTYLSKRCHACRRRVPARLRSADAGAVPPVRSPPPTRRGRAGQPYRRAREREPGRCTPRLRKTHGREDPAVPSAHTSHAWMAGWRGGWGVHQPCVGRHRFRLARSSVDPCMDGMVCSQTFRKV